MICKTPSNFQVEKLRVIQLLEADINMFLRIIWGRKLVRNTLHNDLLCSEQLGNKPGTLGF